MVAGSGRITRRKEKAAALAGGGGLSVLSWVSGEVRMYMPTYMHMHMHVY